MNTYGPQFVQPGTKPPEPAAQCARSDMATTVAGQHVWLITRLDLRDDPQIAMPTKEAAKEWIRVLHPTLRFSGEDRRGQLFARSPETNFAKYRIQRLPFGQPL